VTRWIWLGAFFFLSIPALIFYEIHQFEIKEPYYSNPIVSNSAALSIRSDAYGKGYFGASRNGRRLHAGIDLTAPIGSPVLASKSGRVYFAGDDKGYGHYIEIRHPDGLTTRYAHLSELQVSEGSWISQGQVIGLSGRSGNAIHPSIKPHLHFEIRYKGQPLNPGTGLLDPKLNILS
jgi:murein DD-endopeptidase MepM/ murein hydrolase activator NlpD